jgi:hypothetical protein
MNQSVAVMMEAVCSFESFLSHIVFLCSVLRLLGTANVPSSPIATLMMEVIRSSKTLVLTRMTWRKIPEDGILHSHRHESLKSYNWSSSFLYNLYF